MALPYLSTNVNFCDDDESKFYYKIFNIATIIDIDMFCILDSFYHNPELPTKQNLYCNGKSTWSVIEDSDDFKDGANPPDNTITNPEPQFVIVGGEEQEMSYVLVMDVSISMTTGIDRLSAMKDAAKRWVMFDVRDGIKLGALPFSSYPVPKDGFNMTVVDDQSREEIIEKINNLKVISGTCITDALFQAAKSPGLLNDQEGNSIILLTDGVQSKGHCGTNYEEAKTMLISNKIRLITIAMGDDADPEIESLAVATGGKTYFIDDESGPGEFSDALVGSTTSQAAETMNNTDIVIFQQSWSSNQTINGTFDVDSSIGNNMTFRLEVKNGNQNCEEGIDIKIFTPGQDEPLHVNFMCTQGNLGTLLFQFNGTANIGNWRFVITTEEWFDSISVIVTSRSRETGDDPIQTTCWFNQGEEDIEGNTVMKVSVMAEVTKGNMPVMGAMVQAYITRPLDNETSPAIEMELLDNGSGKP